MGSIEKKLSYLLGTKNAIKEAIVSKGVEVTNDHTFREYASLIKNINVSGEQPSEDEYDNLNDVVFYDYDGTILYSYNKDEALALEELPELPSHGGLVCEGWNWNLDEIKKRVQECGFVDIGAIYNTYDGKTRIYINIQDYNVGDTLTFMFKQSIANGFTINWGDESSEEEFDISGDVNATHEYSTVGNYIITITVKKDCLLTLGQNSTLFSNKYEKYKTIINRIHLGDRIQISSHSLEGSAQLCTIPNSVTYSTSHKYMFGYMPLVKFIALPRISAFNMSFSENLFDRNEALAISVPYELTKFYTSSFYNTKVKRVFVSANSSSATSICRGNTNLLKVAIGTSYNAFQSTWFYGCTSLKEVTLCEYTKTFSVGNQCFMDCYSLPYIDWSIVTAVPTLSNVNAFEGCSSQLKHIVPDDLYDTWIAATNWSTFASQIVKASEFNA